MQSEAYASATAVDVCMAPECVTAAAAIIESLDEGVDPCEDFYGFACNGWIERHQIPKGQSAWSVTDQRSEDNLELLRNLLEQPLDHRCIQHLQLLLRFIMLSNQSQSRYKSSQSFLLKRHDASTWIFSSGWLKDCNYCKAGGR